MMGYLNNPAATLEAFSKDGWVRTGDVGFIREGKWYVVDRTKDLIKVRGWQVSPVEIEAALLEHELITDAGVIGVAAKDGTGEVPIAFVVKSKDHLQEEDVKSFLASRLARYKGIDDVIFVDSIPRNPTGKILRRVLRDLRVVSPTTTDQSIASAYSTAIKDLEKYQQERDRESQLDGHQSVSPCGSPRSMRTASLTDASTISGDDAPTPPPMTETALENPNKRSGESLTSPPAKRRSARVAAIRTRD
jgi:hypothetical protein